ncbi:MAG: hypothetical protein DI628_01575 [Blastochloris viridis]|uniref:Methyl-accepting transducer domain-containing protein n=1 Tax=Blastochloris viridis TaxID=1079 RepID=A0A6N4RE89_BLAVI|nr:MAG: hypothetical protein DI628_01575 [Blastochloris viridis]
MNSLSLRQRLFLVIALSIFSMFATIGIGLWSLYGVMMQDRMDKTHNLVQTADSIIESYGKRAESGEMTVEQAQDAAKLAIRAIRYGKDDYFWINDMQPKMVMHPMKPALEGKDLSKNADPNGKLLFVEMVKIATEKGEGFVDYMWAKPGTDTTPYPKLSYVKQYKPWGWIVGTGIYIDDVRAEVINQAVILAALAGVVLVVLITSGLIICRSILSPLRMFADDLGRTSNELSGVIEESSRSTNTLAAAAQETSNQSELIKHSVHEANGQVANVHRALEELNVSISDISKNVGDVNTYVRQAVDKTARTNEVVSRLTETTQKISEVVSLITSLADQTNLLALNAAIEAARAGDAGRGFAVVADEVKKLATNTGNATEEIGQSVMNIKSAVNECVTALEDVVKSVQQIQDNTNAMSAAVEEQTSVVQNVTMNMRGASEHVGAVATNIEGIEEAIRDSAQSNQELASISEELNRSFGTMHKNAIAVFRRLGLTVS